MKFIIQHSETNGKQLKATEPSEQSKKDGSQCYYNIVAPSNKIQCDQCKRDISKSAKILTQSSDYCISCFANIEEFSQYHAINKLDYPLIDIEWTADEEVMLFQGLQKHGFGNWGEIAEFIGTNKTKEEVQVHYVTYFLETPNFLPDVPVITHRDESGKLIQTGFEEPYKKLQKANTGIFSSHSIQNFKRGSLTLNQMPSGSKTGNNPSEIVGYMPKRGDFQVQFENDAQLLLAEMEFNQDDSQQETKMKFRLIDIYNQKLTQRVRRKEFVVSRKLLDLKEQMRLDKTRTKQEKEISNMMKVFARFSTPDEHDQLVQGLIKQKQIRARLEELKDLKKKGFRSISHLDQELENKKKREEKLKKDLAISQPDKYKSPYLLSKRSKKQSIIEVEEMKPLFPSSKEEQLCERFGITLQEFQIIKATLIRESLRQEIIEIDTASRMFKLNRSIISNILDFLVQKDELYGNWKESNKQKFVD